MSRPSVVPDEGEAREGRESGRNGRRRVEALSGAVVVVLAGLAARFAMPGVLGDVAGGVLYAVLVYLLVVMIAPRAKVITGMLIALAIAWGVEFLQLTDLPAALASAFWPARFVFGTTFVVTDLVSAGTGVLLAGGLDAWRRSESTEASAP